MKILILGGGGYIGARLYQELLKHYEVSIEDNGYSGIYRSRDIEDISIAYLERFSRIIWLAGCSSVPMASRDKKYAVEQNVYVFERLLEKLDGWEGIFYYASSASVYGRARNLSRECDILEEPLTVYDDTKRQAEYIASQYDVRSVALRFGTVCGYSPNYRTDLVVNSLVEKGLKDQHIDIFNPSTRRGILALTDLCDFFVYNIGKEIGTNILNLCSVNTTIEEIGSIVARRLKVPMILQHGTESPYDFHLDIAKVKYLYSWYPQCNLESIVDELLSNRYFVKYSGRS